MRMAVPAQAWARCGLRLALLSMGVACALAFIVPFRSSPGSPFVWVDHNEQKTSIGTNRGGDNAGHLLWKDGGGQQGGLWRRGGVGSGGRWRLWMAKRELADISPKDFYEALQTFIETYEKREMPEDFVVPFDAKRWPDRLHGVKLGRHYQKLITDGEIKDQDPAMADRVSRELGVRIGLSDWEKCILGLREYTNFKGTTKLPKKWVVPDEDPWPREIRGYRLGLRVDAIRQTGKFVNLADEEEKSRRMQALDELGFEWKLRGGKKDKVAVEELDSWYEQLLEGLNAYKKIVGDLDTIKSTYTIPSTPDWPENVRGMPLGQKLTYIKQRSNILTDYPERKEELLRMGVNLTTRESQIEERFQAILLALQTYKKIHRQVNVPQSFVVPDNEKWPEEVRGMRLGIRVNAIRSQQTFVRNNPERRKILEDLGLDTKPVKAMNRKKLDKDYKYVDDEEGEGIMDGDDAEGEEGEGGVEGEEGAGGGASALPPASLPEEPGRKMTKEEILAMQEKAGLDWYFVGRQPGQTWFQQVEDLGLGNYPFLPLLTPEQHAKTKQKGEVAMRGSRINPTFVIQPPALKQHASEVECFPTGSLLDNLVEEAASELDPDEDQVVIMGKLKEDTRINKIDYRRKLVPDSDIDKETPCAMEEEEYWAALSDTTDGEMSEFGDGGSFHDIIHALEIFKERYGHVRVPPAFEFSSPEGDGDGDGDEEDWFRSWSSSRKEVSDDWDQDAEPEFVDTAISLSTLYDAKAVAARRREKEANEQRPELTGFFEDDEEEDEEGGGERFLLDDEEGGATEEAVVGSGEPDPEDDDDVIWPDSVVAMPLGDVCWMLRAGVIAAKDVPERRAALDALGFDWSPEDMYVNLRWDVFLGTYYHWRVIKGVPLVPWDYIVPEEAPWPFFCRGVELGKMCNLIRQKEDVFMKYYPERCQTLEIFGWKWWWPTLTEEEMLDIIPEPQPYNRYNNFQGLDELIALKFVDPNVTDLVTQPDWDALAAELPESIPWNQQDHRPTWDANLDLPTLPRKKAKKQQSPTSKGSTNKPAKKGEATPRSSSVARGNNRPSARRRYFPMRGEEDVVSGGREQQEYDQEVLDFISSWDR